MNTTPDPTTTPSSATWPDSTPAAAPAARRRRLRPRRASTGTVTRLFRAVSSGPLSPAQRERGTPADRRGDRRRRGGAAVRARHAAPPLRRRGRPGPDAAAAGRRARHRLRPPGTGRSRRRQRRAGGRSRLTAGAAPAGPCSPRWPPAAGERPLRVWAHGDLPAAAALAQGHRAAARPRPVADAAVAAGSAAGAAGARGHPAPDVRSGAGRGRVAAAQRRWRSPIIPSRAPGPAPTWTCASRKTGSIRRGSSWPSAAGGSSASTGPRCTTARPARCTSSASTPRPTVVASAAR